MAAVAERRGMAMEGMDWLKLAREAWAGFLFLLTCGMGVYALDELRKRRSAQRALPVERDRVKLSREDSLQAQQERMWSRLERVEGDLDYWKKQYFDVLEKFTVLEAEHRILQIQYRELQEAYDQLLFRVNGTPKAPPASPESQEGQP